MRVPDRPWAATDAYSEADRRAGPEYRARPEDLGVRLARLLAGHPSADSDQSNLNPEQLDPDHTDLDDVGYGADDASADDPSLDDEDLGDLAAEDLDSGEVSPGDGADMGVRQHRGADSRTWEGLRGEEHGPYRPWFSADGASDPWFAEPTELASQ